MTLIDHRVLVSAPPEIVWELLSDLTALPKWHVNCTQASILTSHRTGTGTRRRITRQKGPSIVEEILSWYSNLGYEYTIVDGMPFSSNRGRVRLQPIPEGTIVQWTLEYQHAGFMSGLRDRLATRRQLNKEIQSSLKRLKKLVESTGIRMDAETRERVSLRPAPTASERAALSESLARTQVSEPVRPAEQIVEHPPITSLMETLPTDQAKRLRDSLRKPSKEAPAEVNQGTTPLPSQSPPTRPALPAFDTDVFAAPETPPDFLDEAREAAAAKLDGIQAEIAMPEENASKLTEMDKSPDWAEPDLEVTGEPEDAAEGLSDAPVSMHSEPDEGATTTVEMPAGEPSQIQEAPDAAPVSVQEDEHTPALPLPQEAPPAKIETEQPVVGKSLLEREELQPVGPSIWEVFGMQAPSAEQTEPESATEAPSEGATAIPSSKRSGTGLRLQARPLSGKRSGLRRRLNQQAMRHLR